MHELPAQAPAPRWTSSHWRFAALMLAPVVVIEAWRVPGMPGAGYLASHLTLATAPPALEGTLRNILFVPIGALVVVAFRLALGVHVLGPFRSILLAFAFLATGIWFGLIFLAATVAILVFARPMLEMLKLPYFGRISMMLCLVVLLLTTTTLLGGWLHSPVLGTVAHFPIIVLVLVGDKVATTIRREGALPGVWRAAMTALTGVVVTGIAFIPGLAPLLLRRPELMLAEMTLIVIVSSLCNWRLLEGLNPRPRSALHTRPAGSRRGSPGQATPRTGNARLVTTPPDA